MSGPERPPPTDEELVAALEPIVGSTPAKLERRMSPNRSSHPLEMLTATTAGGARVPIVFKDLSPPALDRTARAARSEVEDVAWRELDVYRYVLSGTCGVAPRWLGELRDAGADRYWLFLEPVDGAELYKVGRFEVWIAALASLAVIHGELDGVPPTAGLRRYDERFFTRWPARAVAYANRDDQKLLRRIEDRYDAVLERLRTLPEGVVHGDLYPSNVMIRSAHAERERFAVLDWESAGIGPPLLDVATLTAGAWTADQRERMTLAYRDALPADDRPDRRQFLDDVDCCRLHVAMQWLGWSRVWSPPPEHRHDWAAEARGSAERLALL